MDDSPSSNVVPFPHRARKRKPNAADVRRAATMVLAMCDGCWDKALARAASIEAVSQNKTFASAVVVELQRMRAAHLSRPADSGE